MLTRPSTWWTRNELYKHWFQSLCLINNITLSHWRKTEWFHCASNNVLFECTQSTRTFLSFFSFGIVNFNNVYFTRNALLKIIIVLLSNVLKYAIIIALVDVMCDNFHSYRTSEASIIRIKMKNIPSELNA